MTMPTIPDLWSILTSPTAELLGWTLLHFVWQGALLAALLAGVLSVMKNHAPRVRYAVSCVALLGLFALPIGTGVLLGERMSTTPSPSPASVESLERPSTGVLRAPSATVEDTSTRLWQDWATARLQPVIPWLALGWAVGVILFSIRLVGGAWRVRKLRRAGTTGSAEWQSRLQTLAERVGLRRRVVLRESPHVNSPMVTGWWRSVILVPAGLLSGLPPDQVEAVLLHELAHIRRHDVLVARFQAVVETLLFFHPATWWVSKQVRQTREACCDDVAVRSGPERKVYARALAALAEQAVSHSPSAWTPAASDGSLLARIRRLLSPTASPSRYTQRLSMTVAVLVMVAVPVGLAACASQQSATGPEEKAPADVEAPPASEAPSADAKRGRVVVPEDSTEPAVRVVPDTSVTIDRLDSGVYGRYGPSVDTLALPGRMDTPDLDALEQPFHLESDSLEQKFRTAMKVDSLLKEGEDLHVDLPNADEGDLFGADTNRVEFFRWRDVEGDSTFVFDHEAFERQEFDFDAGFDSLRLGHWKGDVDRLLHQRGAVNMDSLVQEQQQVADSLRRQFEREMPEQLREQARHLRDQAARLERQAEEMESPKPPSSPSLPDSG